MNQKNKKKTGGWNIQHTLSVGGWYIFIDDNYDNYDDGGDDYQCWW